MAASVRVDEETTLVGHITVGQVLQQPAALRTPLGSGEFLATLGAGTPGSPGYVVGRRVAGRSYDHIVLDFGPTGADYRRVWERVADHGEDVTYTLVDDTSSHGFAGPAR